VLFRSDSSGSSCIGSKFEKLVLLHKGHSLIIPRNRKKLKNVPCVKAPIFQILNRYMTNLKNR
jgi:hypothetical protein